MRNLKRENNPAWKGGKVKTSHGYVLVLVDIKKYEYEHRVVASTMLGRPLRRNEVVHHKNGIKHDNRPLNLQVFSCTKKHAEAHHPNSTVRKFGEPNPFVRCRCGCGSSLRKFDSKGRKRDIIHGHNGNRSLSPWAKIPEESVPEILNRRESGESGASIAASIGVNRSTVNKLVKKYSQ